MVPDSFRKRADRTRMSRFRIENVLGLPIVPTERPASLLTSLTKPAKVRQIVCSHR